MRERQTVVLPLEVNTRATFVFAVSSHAHIESGIRFSWQLLKSSLWTSDNLDCYLKCEGVYIDGDIRYYLWYRQVWGEGDAYFSCLDNELIIYFYLFEITHNVYTICFSKMACIIFHRVHSKPINESEYGNKVRIIHQDLVIESGSSWGSADEPYFGHNGRTNFPYEQPSG